MPTSRSGAGGKIVTNRRKQRLAATPYDRPSPQRSPLPPPKSPNWFAGIVVPSARAIASGAGKILSSIFSESESSSSEDEGSAPEDDVDNNNTYEDPYNGINKSNQKNVTSSEIMQFRQESQLTMWQAETKKLIEQLIMQETFSREECDKLIQVLNSRVIGWSANEGEKSSLAGSFGKTTDHEDADIYNKAVQEAQKWFEEKKLGSSSVAEFAHGPSKLNLSRLEQVGSGGNSPVDVARSYMKDRPPWGSPTRDLELRTPLTTTMKLFNEGTLYSVGHDSLSSSKKWSSLPSGSWNIQEELRRVRSKATEDMLRTPSTKIDSSWFAVAQNRGKSVEAGKEFEMGEKLAEPESFGKAKSTNELVDAGVSYDPALAALESKQDGKASEAVTSRPATFVYQNNEDTEPVRTDGECDASKFPHTSSPSHAEEHHTDPHIDKTNGPPTTEVTEFGMKQSINGLSSSHSSLPVVVENHKQRDVENQDADTVNEKESVNIQHVEGNCELLSEAFLEVPIVTETDSIASGSQSSLGIQNEELPQDMTQPSPKEKVDIVARKQQGRKSGKKQPKKQRKR